MAAVLAAASYSRGVVSPFLAVSARRVMVPGGIMFHLEPGAIHLFGTKSGSNHPSHTIYLGGLTDIRFSPQILLRSLIMVIYFYYVNTS